MKKKFLTLLMAGVMALGMVGCGGASEAEAPEAPAAEDTADAALDVVFVVTGQLGDKSFNDSANAGVTAMAETMGCNTKVIEIGRDQTKWQPTFEDLAEGGAYDLIITNGSNAGELVLSIAEMYPEQKFVLFDMEMEGDHPNVYTISYEQNEASYLAGVLAAMVTKSDMPNANEENKIGFIGGEEHPIITDFLVGYIEGARSVSEDIKVYVSYVGSWDDTARGKETAIAQYNQGVDIIFPAAEQAGLGCVDAAVEMGKYIIGVDSDQAMLFDGVSEEKANVILTSVLKEVGNSLVRAASMEMEGTLPWGTFESLGLAEEGVGLADNQYYQANVPEDIKTAVDAANTAVMNGEVTVTSALHADAETSQAIIDSVAP